MLCDSYVFFLYCCVCIYLCELCYFCTFVTIIIDFYLLSLFLLASFSSLVSVLFIIINFLSLTQFICVTPCIESEQLDKRILTILTVRFVAVDYDSTCIKQSVNMT